MGVLECLDNLCRYAFVMRMASLHKQPGRPNWFCAFTTADGQRHFKSTGTADKKQSRQIAASWESAASLARSGKLTEEKARAIIANGVNTVLAAVGETIASSSIKDFFENWLKTKEQEVTFKSHKRYGTVVNQLIAFLGPKAQKDIAQLSSKDITDFRTEMGKRLSRGTVNTALKIVRTALSQARRDGMISINEAQKVSTLQTESSKRRPFTLPEVQRILAVAGTEWRGMILVGLYTGLRLGDVAQLTWANVSLQQRDLTVATRKTGRTVVLPIAKPLAEYLHRLPSSDDPAAPLFPNAFAAKERSDYGGTLSNQFYQLLVTAGLAPKRPHVAIKKGRSAKRQVGGLSFHCLRHTATSLLKNAGVSDVVARDIIGHESEAVSRVYTHIDFQTKLDAIDKLADVTKKTP
jgi:integrase